MFSSVKNTVKSWSKVTGLSKTEKRSKMVELVAMREEMFPNLLNIGARSKKLENEYEMVDFKPEDFYHVERQDYNDFYTLGEGFTLLVSPLSLCQHLVEVEI